MLITDVDNMLAMLTFLDAIRTLVGQSAPGPVAYWSRPTRKLIDFYLPPDWMTLAVGGRELQGEVG